MIRIYALNGLLMQTRDDMHAHLKHQLRLAEHYGNNLDALWDLLSERTDGGFILVEFASRMPEELLAPLRALLTELCERHDCWQFSIVSGSNNCHGDCGGCADRANCAEHAGTVESGEANE